MTKVSNFNHLDTSKHLSILIFIILSSFFLCEIGLILLLKMILLHYNNPSPNIMLL